MITNLGSGKNFIVGKNLKKIRVDNQQLMDPKEKMSLGDG
jgi:hypothetical protein